MQVQVVKIRVGAARVEITRVTPTGTHTCTFTVRGTLTHTHIHALDAIMSEMRSVGVYAAYLESEG